MRVKHKRLGLAFQEEVFKVTHPFGHFKHREINDAKWEDSFIPNYETADDIYQISSWKLMILASIMLIIFSCLFLRIFHLQVVAGNENKERADSNRIQLKVIHAPRGVIYDRNGKIIAENIPGFRIGEKIISRDESLVMEAKNDPELNKLEVDSIRHYPFNDVTSHVLGYLGQITEAELLEPKYKDYKIGDRIGRSGIEQVYETVLRGTDGAEIIEIDASGNKLRTLRKVEPVPGLNLHLSLDADLQKAVFAYTKTGIEKLKICCGAAIVQNPQNGQILAMVSFPQYDGNAFTDPNRSQDAGKYLLDQNAPLLNRAISGTYPPGSTFKITSALAGLSSGKITKDTFFEDTGITKIGIWTFANWYFTSAGKTEGSVNIVKALQRSNDTFFYRVGEAVGEKVLGDTARKIGFGRKLEIDLPGEEAGVIPDSSWKKKNIGEVWYPGDSLHMAIGQGFVLTTPLQILSETSFIAANGQLFRPVLVTKISQQNDQTVKEFGLKPIAENLFKKSDIDLIKEGLSQVPKDGGTAWPFFNFTISSAGKTGTAETAKIGETEAWYTAYAPVENPQITVTVLLEKGGEGSNVSAPIVKDIFTWYFSPDKNKLENFDKYAIATESAKILGE